MMMKYLLLIPICICLFSANLSFGEEAAAPSSGVQVKTSDKDMEVSRFDLKEDADKFAAKMRESGYESFVLSDVTNEGKTVFKVFVRVHGDLSQGSGRYSWDIFGKNTGYFHPAVALTSEYTDNAFHTQDNRKSNYSLILSPEIIIAVPPITQKQLGYVTVSSIRSPSGLALSILNPEVQRRFTSVLHYRADIPLNNSDNSPSDNTVEHFFTAGVQYNGNKLSANAMDQFIRSYELRGSPDAETDRYISNLFDAQAAYDTGNRFRFRLDYSNYILKYDEDRNMLRDRMDNSLSGYAFFRLQPKTMLFAEYTVIDVDYDHNDVYDNMEYNIYGGVEWEITAKSKGRVKVGYGNKKYDLLDEKYPNFLVEFQATHRFTQKTAVSVQAYRKTLETDLQRSSLYILATGAGVNLQHRFSPKVVWTGGVLYENDKYRDRHNEDVRNDDIFMATTQLKYHLKPWLALAAGYTFEKRDSNLAGYSYRVNELFFSIKGSL